MPAHAMMMSAPDDDATKTPPSERPRPDVVVAPEEEEDSVQERRNRGGGGGGDRHSRDGRSDSTTTNGTTANDKKSSSSSSSSSDRSLALVDHRRRGHSSSYSSSRRRISWSTTTPSFSKIDPDDCPLNGSSHSGDGCCSVTVATSSASASASALFPGASFGGLGGSGVGGGWGASSSSFAAAAVDESRGERGYVDSTDLTGYVRELRRDLIRSKEEEAEAAAAAAAKATEGAMAPDNDDADPIEGGLPRGETDGEEGDGDADDGDVNGNDFFGSGSGLAAAPVAPEEVAVPAADESMPKSGPWRKLVRRIGGGGAAAAVKASSSLSSSSSSSHRGLFVSSSRSVVSSARSDFSVDGTTASAPSHLEQVHKNDATATTTTSKYDPRVSEIESLREDLSQIEFQNGLRDELVDSLRSTRDQLERELDTSRNEQLELTMKSIDEQERAVKLRSLIDGDLASEVTALRKKVEKRHGQLEAWKRKVAKLEKEEEERERRRRLRQRQQRGSDEGPRRGQHPHSRDRRRHTFFLPKEDGDGKTSSSRNGANGRRDGGRASFMDHLHLTKQAREPDVSNCEHPNPIESQERNSHKVEKRSSFADLLLNGRVVVAPLGGTGDDDDRRSGASSAMDQHPQNTEPRRKSGGLGVLLLGLAGRGGGNGGE